MQLNDLAIGPHGTVFVTDSGLGSVWLVESGSHSAPRLLVGEAALPGANGVAWDAARGVLFVAHSTGLARIAMPEATLLPRVSILPRQTVGAIDGLHLDRGDLIGIQNITNPGRVIRMRLDPSGERIVEVETLLSHHHAAIDEPTTGAVTGTTLRVLATTQLSRLGADGRVRDESSLKRAAIVDVPLRRNARQRLNDEPAP